MTELDTILYKITNISFIKIKLIVGEYASPTQPQTHDSKLF